MVGPPTGTVTFLFTDIEGSTRLWEKSPEAMSAALVRHDEILASAIETRDGFVFKRVGDAFCAAFPTAADALEAALSAQRSLLDEEWGEEIGTLRVRTALHTGAVEERSGDYFGPPVNRVARLLSAGHGGQTLLSLATQELLGDKLPEGVSLRDLGERRLKDLFRPERVFQVLAPDLPSRFPPLMTLDARLNNLPAQPTPLVGRERELREVAGLLRREAVRLLTLTGAGGRGKTCLGFQAAAELLDEFEDGAFFVPLVTITDPELVASAIAGPLGLIESADQPLAESLEDHLKAKELLLVLDNFEQVVEAAPLVGELLATCPRLKVLATSRTVLRVYGEREYPVPPLALPDPRRPPPVEALAEYEAVRLFIQRAQAAKVGFEVTNENAPAVAEICVRLDGLPLAIELAAARVKLLPPEKMLDRLGSRLKLLGGGARNLPERQRTLRGAIDWSHALLGEEERTLFARMAVFVGGCTLESAEEICDAEGDLGMDVLEGVGSLVDKSLLRQEEDTEGEPRFVMLETIREYASEKLEESGEAGELRRLHAEHFLTLAGEAEPELTGPEQLAYFRRLETEHGNIRAALSWSLEEGGDTELGLRLAGAIHVFWVYRGHLAALGQGDHARATALFAEALALFRKLGDPLGIAECLEGLAGVAGARGEGERAARLYGAADSLRESIGAPLPSGNHPRYERHLAASRSQLYETAWKKAWAEGQVMTPGEAVAYALGEDYHARGARTQPEERS